MAESQQIKPQGRYAALRGEGKRNRAEKPKGGTTSEDAEPTNRETTGNQDKPTTKAQRQRDEPIKKQL
jgi:hypothetical protein